MSAVLTQLGGLAVSAFSNQLSTIPQGQFIPASGSPILVQATFEETSTDLVTVTDNPVEAGTDTTDNAYYRPAELVMRCGWSNSSIANLVGAVSTLFSGGGTSQFAGFSSNLPVSGGGMSVSDYVSGIYAQLLSLQQSLQPFSVVTSIRKYTNMMMTSLAVTRDQKTSQALMVTATMRQIIITSTVSTTLAPIANQATPASTSETLNQGPQALQPNATPAPGGSAPPATWPEGSDEAQGIFEPGESPT